MRVINANGLCSTTIITDDYSGNEIFGNCLKEDIDEAPTIEAIPIPRDATNGDMIKAMFPSCKQKEYMSNDYFEMYFDADLKNASYMRVSKDWWNAPYKKGGEE